MSRRGPATLAPSERGQATLELALCLPALAFVAALLVQVGVVVLDQTRLWHAAREAARVAVVQTDPADAEAAVRAVGLSPVDVHITPPVGERRLGDPLTVSLTFKPSGGVPLVSALFGGITLRASATMRIEQP